MVRSMTGYGRGEALSDGLRIIVELRAVNNRYLDVSCKTPRAYLFAESEVKDTVKGHVGRGKVDVFVSVERAEGEAVTVTVNESAALAYLDALDRLRELCEGRGIQKEYLLADLARLPDVLTAGKREEDPEKIKDGILSALKGALSDFNAMREREGLRLQADVEGRADAMEAFLSRVEERAPDLEKDYRERLLVRLREAMGNVQVDEGRILTEAAIYADKTAVDEETVRLRSHLSQLRELFLTGGAVGRKLDFLIQEMNRETNTIGSKCGDLDLVRLVVEMKAEIEKMREQVQNLE